MIDLNDFNEPAIPIDELNAMLEKVMHTMNETPDPEMGNLTPGQVEQLLYTPWSDPRSPLQLRRDLNLADLKDSAIFINARHFLQALADTAPVKPTTTGNLPRSFVRPLLEIMMDAEKKELFFSVTKVVNEMDYHDLHVARVLCEVAGLIGKSKGCFVIRKKAAHLLADENAGELFARLLETFFKKFNMHYGGVYREAPFVQASMPYTLYRLQLLENKGLPVDALADKILLPSARISLEDLAEENEYWTLPGIVNDQIIRPLHDLGFVQTPREKTFFYDIKDTDVVSPTPLMMKALSVDFSRT